MSSFVRFMSTEAVGVGEVVLTGAAPLQARTSTARRLRIRTAPIHLEDMGRLVGWGAHFRSMLRLPFGRRSAEALVVDVLGDRRVLATDRALGITPQAHFAE